MRMAEAPPVYTTRAGDVDRDRDAVLSIWRGNLGDAEAMAAKYAWFYQDAPAGPPLLRLLGADGADAGICTAGRRRMLLDGRPLQGGVLVDMAVVPAHRSLGPALMLLQGLKEGAARECALLYGFPNPKAAPVFRRIGYRPAGDLVRYVRVLRHAPYFARRMPRAAAGCAGAAADLAGRVRDLLRAPATGGLRTAWLDAADPRMQALWDASTKPDGVAAVRDLAHLAWRFDRAPGGGFRYFAIGEADGSLDAWFAVRRRGDSLVVHDYWSVHGPAIGTRRIAALLRAARARGHASVSVELATSPGHLAPWLASEFRERSRRPLFCHWSDTAHDAGAIPFHLTAADEDE